MDSINDTDCRVRIKTPAVEAKNHKYKDDI